jgi:pimeloyl-ACP methyl ester carboxylesterase
MLFLVLKIAGILLLAYLVIAVLAWKFQDRLAFPAPDARLPDPAAAGLPDGQRITVTTTDGVTLHGWYLPPHPAPPAGERAPGLIWFYGNMETIAGIAPVLREFRPPGIGVVALDYRGYGESEGSATEAGVYRDADAAWDYLTNRPEIDSTRIGVYGRSIGSAVALYLATSRPVRALVLESAFSSGHAMAREHYAFFPQSLVKLDLDNVERATRLTIPLLSVHGSADWIAPIEMGRAVAEAGHAEEFYVIEGSGHNDTYDIGGDAYRQRVHRFLEEHLR